MAPLSTAGSDGWSLPVFISPSPAPVWRRLPAVWGSRAAWGNLGVTVVRKLTSSGSRCKGNDLRRLGNDVPGRGDGGFSLWRPRSAVPATLSARGAFLSAYFVKVVSRWADGSRILLPCLPLWRSPAASPRRAGKWTHTRNPASQAAAQPLPLTPARALFFCNSQVAQVRHVGTKQVGSSKGASQGQKPGMAEAWGAGRREAWSLGAAGRRSQGEEHHSLIAAIIVMPSQLQTSLSCEFYGLVLQF